LARSHIYNLALLDTLKNKSQNKFDMSIKTSCGKELNTQAAFVLVSNQSVIGGNFVSAPYTLNDDGTFDLLLLETKGLKQTLKALLKTKNGLEPSSDYRRFELSSFELKSKTPIKFFGDGEILETEILECRVDCLPQYLPILTSGGH
jgi:diacylglycerol kinase family enzyme